MGVTSIDTRWEHLFPTFREKMRWVLDELERTTRVKWRLGEGYRSPARQLYLYGQGRTRPGDVITWMRYPKWHGSGLAGDFYPTTKAAYKDHQSYVRLREVYQQVGLANTAWHKGDFGHVQMGSEQLRVTAVGWAERGFPALPAPGAPVSPAVPAPAREVEIMVNGVAFPEAPCYIDSGRCYVAARPICNALGFAIIRTTQKRIWIEADPEGAGELDPSHLLAGADLETELQIRSETIAGKAVPTGFVAATAFSPLCSVVWNGASKRIKFFTRAVGEPTS